MRVRVYLTSYNETKDFCQTLNLEDFKGKAELVSGDGRYRVNAKSFLGCLLAHSEWGGDIYFESEEDLYSILEPWIAVTYNDAAYIHE